MTTVATTVFIGFLSWVSMTVVNHGEALASINSQQIEDARVNNIVYNLSEVIPTIGQSLEDINKTLDEHTTKIDEIVVNQRDTRVRIYCISTFPDSGDKSVYKKREACIDGLSGK